MKRAEVVAVLVLAFVACKRAAPAMKEAAPFPHFLAFSRLGADIGPDGMVSVETTSFTAGQPVHLSLKLNDSPAGLQTRAIWTDAKGSVVERDLKNMRGAKAVTFTLKTPLQPGRYHVDAYWGGNVAAEKDFEVAAPGAKGKG